MTGVNDPDTDMDSDKEEENAVPWQKIPSVRISKRTLNDSPKVQQCKRLMLTQNRFDLLSDENDNNDNNDDNNNDNDNNNNNNLASKESDLNIKPPPIYIPEVNDINSMIQYILGILEKTGFSYKTLRDNQVKLTINSVTAYRDIITFLDLKKISYHTYQHKKERAYRAVIKNIHHTTQTTEIKRAIEQMGHKVRNITNVRSRANKNPLPMFFVDLEPNLNNKEIFNVRSLNNAIVSIEPPKKIMT